MYNAKLMGTILLVQIEAPLDTVRAIYTVLESRRGHVINDKSRPGTPMYVIKVYVPDIDSLGLETDMHSHTQGQPFCLSSIHHLIHCSWRYSR